MPPLQEKFRGCIAGSWIGSAIGAPVEGWLPDRIEEEYGVLDEPVSYEHYDTGWERPPGTTEDGIERQKLMATAIIEKGDRILPHDLVDVWLRDLDPERMVYKQEPFDRTLFELARAGVPPTELGRLWQYPNINTVVRSSHPLGLINAGDPAGAARDTFDVGTVYVRETTPALHWGAMVNAAIAEACRPDATVDSVIRTARTFAEYRLEDDLRHQNQPGTRDVYRADNSIGGELDRAVEIAAGSSSWRELREEFYSLYSGGRYVTYGRSLANEVAAKGFAIFAFHEGNPEKAIETAVNFGRDTDCLAAVAGGLSGTLSGPESLPRRWVELVNNATEQDPYTNDQRTIEETADGLYEAYRSRWEQLHDYVELMG